MEQEVRGKRRQFWRGRESSGGESGLSFRKIREFFLLCQIQSFKKENLSLLSQSRDDYAADDNEYEVMCNLRSTAMMNYIWRYKLQRGSIGAIIHGSSMPVFFSFWSNG
ncbi:ABC-type xenobiotic transporter [Trifolium repens]|nr:ABC-type xenobiotic transporter [Trifolium repens]